MVRAVGRSCDFSTARPPRRSQRREFCSIFSADELCTQADTRGGVVSVDIVFPSLAIIQCRSGATLGEWSPVVLLVC